jgi:hypothetical protein
VTRRRAERGAVAGLEALALGTLVVLGGTVMVVAAWGAISTRASLDLAAREYLRAYTEADDGPTAIATGRRAAGEVLAGARIDPATVLLDEPDPDDFGPCASVAVTLTTRTRGVRLPFGASLGDMDLTVTHQEIVDQRREMTAGDRHDPAGTICAD